MRSPGPGVVTYAHLQRSLRALFANNEAMAEAIQRVILLRGQGKFDAAKEIEEELVTHIAKDRELMAKVKQALRAHYTFLRQIILPATGRRIARQEPRNDDPVRRLAEITIAAARTPRRRRVSSTTSDSEPKQD